MGDVAAEFAGLGESDHGVEVRTVDVDLAAGGVDLFAHLAHLRFEHTVGRRVGDHDAGDLAFVLGDLRIEVVHVHGAVVGRGHDLDLEAREDCRCGVRAVGRLRDEHDGAGVIAARHMVGADGEQSGQFALRAGVGLQGHTVVAGDLDERVLEATDECAPAFGLLGRGKGVDGGEFRPGDGFHLGGGVELHRARAQRDHRPVQCEVSVGQGAQVAHHRGLGAVGAEDGVGEEFGVAVEFRVECGFRNGVGSEGSRRGGREVRVIDPGVDAEGFEQTVGIGDRVGFAEGDSDRGVVDDADVVSGLVGHVTGGFGVGDAQCHGVEELPGENLGAGGGVRGLREGLSEPVDAGGDAGQADGTVVDGVHGGDVGQQRLRGADVARRLLAADVLFAGLQGQAVAGLALGVLGHSDEAAGQLALESGLHGHEAGVGAAEEQGHTEALGRADGDVRTLGGAVLEQGQGKQIGVEGDECAAVMRTVDGFGEVADGAGGAGLGADDAEDVFADEAFGEVGDGDAEVHSLGAGTDDGDGLRVEFGIEDDGCPLLHGTTHQQDRLGDGGGLIEEGGIGDVEAGEVLDDLLEVQQRLEPALGDLGLVRRVGGVPGGVLDQVAADDGRGDRVVVALADELGAHDVLTGEFAQVVQHLELRAACGQVELFVLDGFGDGGARECFEGVIAEFGEHGLGVIGAGADVAVGEGACGVPCCLRRMGE